MHTLSYFKYVNQSPLVFVILFTLAFAGPAQAKEQYQELYESMKERQDRLEEALLAPGSCLGERLDGFLEINFDCSDEVKGFAEDENRDRQALYQLMADDLGLTIEEVGQQKALKYLKGYPKGMMREVKLPSSETTWWNGFPPPPGLVSRVLTLKYAKIMKNPDESSAVVRDNLQQYEAFGVVDQTKGASGQIWYKVTEAYVPKVKPENWDPQILGWIAEKDAIPWRRALVMRFTNAYGRDPSVFFKNPESILEFINENTSERKKRLDDIRSRFKNGSAVSDGVMAMEPLVGSGQEQMIMYPVLDFYSRNTGEDVRVDGMFARLLEVAAQTRVDNSEKNPNRYLPIDILFVMDTTNSMMPYLRMVLEAAENFAMESNNDSLRFGFIGYQDQRSKGFEYEVKTFTDTLQPASEFVHTLQSVSARKDSVKGVDIPESVFEGIDTALDSILWREKAAKIIFVIGDAPGREGNINIRSLRDKANTLQISLYAFHIKNSKVSTSYDKQSKEQYKKLSSPYQGAYGTSRTTPHLLTIDAKSSSFGQSVTGRFKEAKASFETILKTDDLTKLEAEPGSLSELIFQQAMLLLPDESVPEKSISGWVCDKVLSNPGREALAPMILLTEAELDELEQRVKELKSIGEKALRGEGGTTVDFFDLVAQNTRFTMVDPTAVNFRDAFSVPLGIDQLPYDSDIMATTREEFHNQDRVQEFVRAMSIKLRHYEDLRRRQGDATVWKKLSMNAGERDRVVGVELNQLP